MAVVSGIKPGRLPEPLAAVQIDTTLHRFKSRSSSGIPVHGVRFNRTLLGHTHDSFDYMLGKSRVVCNPRGYPINRGTGEYENPKFNSQLIVEV
jgi:hypothetical protein